MAIIKFIDIFDNNCNESISTFFLKKLVLNLVVNKIFFKLRNAYNWNNSWFSLIALITYLLTFPWSYSYLLMGR